jgi:hypothetical protein
MMAEENNGNMNMVNPADAKGTSGADTGITIPQE